MSAFASNQVPSSVATVEQLLALAALAYERSNPNRSILEDVEFTSPVCRCTIQTTPDGKLVLVARAVILLDRTAVEAGNKLWKTAQEYPGGATIPSSFTTN